MCYNLCENINNLKMRGFMKVKDFFSSFLQRDSNDEENREWETEKQEYTNERIEKHKQEEWDKMYLELEENVIPSIYGLVDYHVVTSKFDEKYIVALSTMEEKFMSPFNMYKKASGTIDIFGEEFPTLMSSQKLFFDICEKEAEGKVQKYIHIVDVLITGSRGRGSAAMERLISYAKETKCSWIQGERSVVDEVSEQDRVRRDNFYKKYNFTFEGENKRVLMLRL